MSGLNKVQLIGRIGKDPEIRHTQNGTAVASMSLATSENWTDKNTGEKVEKTEWHNLVFWNKLAEIVEKYLSKGDMIYAEGKLQTRKWQDKEGRDRYTTEIVVATMQMLVTKGDKSQSPPARSQAQQQHDQQKADGYQGAPQPVDDEFDDDLPF